MRRERSPGLAQLAKGLRVAEDERRLLLDVENRYRDAGKRPGKARPHRPKKPCQHEGCTGWAWARGYCDNHYQKLKRQGKIHATRIVGDPIARFRASYKVNLVSRCWEWTGWIHPNGYGILSLGAKSKKIRARRLSWELHHGQIPDGLDVLHRCDNRKRCCPDHLFLGDAVANARDCVAKGRHNSQIGMCVTRITPAMAMNMRIMFARGNHSMTAYGVSLQTILYALRGGDHLKTG
jgi:hypothetical protein